MKTALKVFALAAILSAVGGVWAAAAGGRGARDAALEEVARYRQWTRVTDKPLPVEVASAGG